MISTWRCAAFKAVYTEIAHADCQISLCLAFCSLTENDPKISIRGSEKLFLHTKTCLKDVVRTRNIEYCGMVTATLVMIILELEAIKLLFLKALRWQPVTLRRTMLVKIPSLIGKRYGSPNLSFEIQGLE